jgi:hypothetical protein
MRPDVPIRPLDGRHRPFPSLDRISATPRALPGSDRRRLSELPQVRYVGASTGRVDLIIEVVVKTNQDLADFLMDDLGALDGITDSETNLIVRIYKQSWSWAIRAE